MNKKVLITAVLALITGSAAMLSATNTSNNDATPIAGRLMDDIDALCSRESAEAGRALDGTDGKTWYISRRMEDVELKPMGSRSLIHIFESGEHGERGADVMGMLEGKIRRGTGRYIIVGAHYDNLGIMQGTFYPGADSNASGVAAMLEIAKLLRDRRLDFITYNCSVIFVAFDRFLDGRAGSAEFWRMLEDGELIDPVSHNAITPSKVELMIDLDQIGCTLVPVHKDREEYLIALGNESLPEGKRNVLSGCNREYGLDLNFTYYDSDRFTKAFYRLGDRRHFIDHGIPTMYFTSGITDNNNRPSDTPSTINAEVLGKRAELIFRFIEKMM